MSERVMCLLRPQIAESFHVFHETVKQSTAITLPCSYNKSDYAAGNTNPMSLSTTTLLWYKKWRDCTWACWISHQLTFETRRAGFFTIHQLSWTLPSALLAKNA